MVEVTQADIATALAHLGFDSVDDLHYWSMDDNELNRFDALVQAFATHRIEAARAERDRLRELAKDKGFLSVEDIEQALDSQP